MRVALFGSLERWASLKPRRAVELGGDDPVRQVVAQALVLEQTLADAARRLAPEHLVEVEHAELCAEPEAVVERVRALLSSKGGDVASRGEQLAPFAAQRNDELERDYGERVDAALESIRAELARAHT